MTRSARDHERVRELLGREPRGRYEIVVRDGQGDPVVLRNAPLLDDGTPMPTRYWLIGPAESRRIGQLESSGGVDAAEAAVDPDELAAAHDRYAAERDAAIPDDHEGPRPSGGVGGTRVGVKCLHAHWGWHLAGGDDPVGRWIEQQLAGTTASAPTPAPTPATTPATTPESESGSESGSEPGPVEPSVSIEQGRCVVTYGTATHAIPWGSDNLTDRWLRADDPPSPEALTNALGTIEDDLDDMLRLHPQVADADRWVFVGPTITSLVWLEAGQPLPEGDHDYPRPTGEEVFRVVATESVRDRAHNPGLPSHHVETIVATSCIIQAWMRHLRLDGVTLRIPD